jgi:hypothetical protein
MKWYYAGCAALTTTLWSLGASAQEQDPAAPIQFLKTAREKAAQSEISADKLSETGSKLGFLAAVFFAVLGIIIAGIGLVMIYQANTNSNSRYTTGTGFIVFLVGAALTILTVLVGIITYSVTG